MRFEFYSEAIANVPKLSVDGTVPNSVHFSHWVGNETPPELKADTSTEIALNLVASPSKASLTQGIELVTNNHFDTDGVLSVWTVLNGERALKYRDVLIAAAEAGDFIVFGAPNVVRGGSHTGWTKASDMIAKGLCSVLASDYYYPAPLLAAFRLAADGVRPLAEAWQLISSAPARAAGLADRGLLATGQRADIILVDDTAPLRPRVVAVIAAGRLVHLAEANRLVRSSTASRKAVAAA